MTTRETIGAPGPDADRVPPPAATRATRPPEPTLVPRRKMPLRARLRRDWPLLLMCAPAMLLLLVFHYLPTLGNVVAFQDYNPYAGDSPLQAFLHSTWIGFGNFETLFNTEGFWQALQNTLTITAFQLVFFFPLPIALALLLNSLVSTKLRAFIQSIVYLPHFFSWVLVVTFFVQMFGGAGLLADAFRDAGLTPWNVMTNPDTFIVLVTAEAVWKDVGWGTIVFLAALSTVDQNQYEAAAVDGAGRWRRLWHITLPALRPVIVLLLILRLGDALTVGFEQFILQRDAVGRQAAEVLDTFVYYQAIVNQQFGIGAAAGLFKAAVGLTLVLLANKVAHMLGEQGVYSKQ
ncbi:ABC transporter permease subunit [Virgisporangium ochraceum]|uniref:Polysaccharide ABC transporter ATP-binding protein n=1 Tax=Virgisporangium ochraceum TaxID=65505 RepID=A0A8J3ZPQ7_9ACTN|nr:ABC transporter permease subunit [Virgisporangium ochraceum]GIJ67561.1 polysaccharide ABC transporter ATP-binding protein [Virgisporangium ochraceum]